MANFFTSTYIQRTARRWLVVCGWAASVCCPRNRPTHAQQLIGQGEGPDNVAQSLIEKNEQKIRNTIFDRSED